MAPVVAESDNPGGRLPDAMDQVYGVVPPVAFTVCEYEVPTVTAGRPGIVTLRAVAPTVMETGAVVDWTGLLLSMAFTVKLETPLPVGVPEIMPDEERDRPAGRLPDATDHA